MSHTQPLVFDLDEDMLCSLETEFNVESLAIRLRQVGANTEEGSTQLRDWGRKLMLKAIELGEQNRDRPYEILLEYSKKPGNDVFPSVIQRFIEISCLSIHNISSLRVTETSRNSLAFGLTEEECSIYAALKNNGQILGGALPCQHVCLSLCETVCEALGMKGSVGFTVRAELHRDGWCEFFLNRKS